MWCSALCLALCTAVQCTPQCSTLQWVVKSAVQCSVQWCALHTTAHCHCKSHRHTTAPICDLVKGRLTNVLYIYIYVYIALQCTSTKRSAVQFNVVQCNAVQLGAVQFSVMLCTYCNRINGILMHVPNFAHNKPNFANSGRELVYLS